MGQTGHCPALLFEFELKRHEWEVYRAIFLTNLLSNVENLPKIRPAAVVVHRQRMGQTCSDQSSTWVTEDTGACVVLVRALFLSLSSVLLVGPRVPVDVTSEQRTQ